MKLLHLTPKKHLNNIQKHGLIPQKVKLEHHLETFQKDGLKNDKCIYLWDPNENISTYKIIEDFIYCKNFIHPRNDIISLMENNWTNIDFSKLGKKLFGDDENYILMEIKQYNILPYTYYHYQNSGGDKYESCLQMDTKYEHSDKPLKIATNNINWKYIKPIAEISSRIYKNNTIGITYKTIYKQSLNT